jgi:hypothetical protein
LFNFELLTALTILWDVLPCSLVEVHRHSTYCHLAGYQDGSLFEREDGHNISSETSLNFYGTTRRRSSYWPLGEFQIEYSRLFVYVLLSVFI